MFELGGARVVIAGGSSGAGLATARLLVRCGARVVLNGRDRAKLNAAQKELGDKASVAAFDATQPADRAQALAKIGAFDHLVAALSGGKGAAKSADLSQSIVFLIANSFMTGCVLECDGGLRLVGQSL